MRHLSGCIIPWLSYWWPVVGTSLTYKGFWCEYSNLLLVRGKFGSRLWRRDGYGTNVGPLSRTRTPEASRHGPKDWVSLTVYYRQNLMVQNPFKQYVIICCLSNILLFEVYLPPCQEPPPWKKRSSLFLHHSHTQSLSGPVGRESSLQPLPQTPTEGIQEWKRD